MALSDAITRLTDAFEDPSPWRTVAAAGGPRTVAISWPAVPIELVRAAGLRPVVVRGGCEATPAADAQLEAGIFPSRLRQLVEAMLAGPLADVRCVVLPRTSDADYRCFLYLRELVRRGTLRYPGSILLFDLLQSAGDDVAAYDASRVRALFEALAPAGAAAPADALREQIAHGNAARAALRRLLALRVALPRVTGTEVLPLLGAFWRLAPDEYARLATEAAHAIARRPPMDRPRVLLVGAPVDGPTLHAAIESHGAVVVAENGPWGAEAAGHDVSAEADPFAALAAKYARDATGPRTPLADARRWITRAAADVEAIVVSLPPDDAVFGWDYPWLREWAGSRGLPHVCLHHDPYQPLPREDQTRLAALVDAAAARVAARHG